MAAPEPRPNRELERALSELGVLQQIPSADSETRWEQMTRIHNTLERALDETESRLREDRCQH